jgi:hypothetical protein
VSANADIKAASQNDASVDRFDRKKGNTSGDVGENGGLQAGGRDDE